MIVRNESKIIDRCIRGCVDNIQAISILDTGSTDDTVKIITDRAKDLNIPCKIDHSIFKNFGESRTESANLAYKNFPDIGYILLLDADMILTGKITEELTGNGYLMMQKNSSIEYFNVRVIKNTGKNICKGVTHEYWDSCDGGRITSAFIDDRNDGGCKADKFERDIRLLKAGIKKQPEHKTRYTFYLAQSLQNSGRPQEALRYYKEHVKINGWNEEVYMSMKCIGNCYDKLDKFEKALGWYVRAWEFRPSRLEACMDAITMCRKLGMHRIACSFLMSIDKVPQSNDSLFVNHQITSCLIDYEKSICCYYVPGMKEEGKSAGERIIANGTAPEYILSSVQDNMKFYE